MDFFLEKGTFMEKRVNLDIIYAPSEDVVAREIEGELIIVPLATGIGEDEDDLFTMNQTGKEIWNRLNGENRLQDVVEELSTEFAAPAREIEKDVVEFVRELMKRKMLVESFRN